jgi:hypothetical protein
MTMSEFWDRLRTAGGDTKVVDLTPYGWGGAVTIRRLCVADMDRYVATTKDAPQDMTDANLRLVLKAWVAPPLPEDADAVIRSAPVGGFYALLREVLTFSGLTTEGQQAAQASFRPGA